MTSNSLDQQNVSVWGWTNSINSFVENTKTASESFFDNVSATLSKKPTQETNIHTDIHNNDDNKLPQQTPPHQQPEEKNQQESDDPNNIFKCEIEEWKSKYSQSKTAYSLKIAMLQNELQKYKDTNSSFNRHISLQTESKIAKFQSQIQKYQQNEKKCINIFKEHIRQYYQNNDDLQHQIETKYKIFYEKLLNITVKAGLDPNDIFESNDSNNNNNNKYETMSVVSDFEEKEVIHNAEEAEEHDIQHIDLDTEYKEKYLQAVEQCNILQQKNSEYNVVCNELSTERVKEKEEYQELVRLFELMSDKNTQFQQLIKDVDGENELLRQQLNQYKLQHESDMDALVLQNVNLKESFKDLQLKYDEIANKLNDEYEIGEQLRQQIKQTAKISNKRNKSNSKLKKKIETFSKTMKTLEYEIGEKNKKLIKYIEMIKEFEYTENKYNKAIFSYKSLQNEIEEYIEESNELKRKIYNLEDEILTNKQHSNELRKQANRDRKNISRLTNCNDELTNILKQCQDILIKSAHKYLSVSVLNAQELELSDTDSDDNDAGNGNIIYFNDSDSDDDDVEEEDDIFIASKEKDIKALQLGARLKIQVSMLSERLKTFQDNMNNLKHKLHRKEEETLQQQYELRQVAMRRRLEAKIKKELRKRENKMVTIASVRGLNIRHKTSLANLTKTQDEVNRIVHDIEENDELWKRNISRQLSGNTKSSSMDLLLMDSLSGSTMASTSLNKRDILETQSMRSLSSANSKKSMQSQTMSVSMHNRRHKQRVRRSAAMQPMQTMQIEKNDKKKKSFNFASKWFK